MKPTLKPITKTSKDLQMQIDIDKTNIDKIEKLRLLLESTVSQESVIPGSNTTYAPVFDKLETRLIKDKLFEIIKKL